MTPLDWVVVAIVAISALQGLRHGLLRELLGFAGAVAGWFLACRYTHSVTPWTQRLVHNIWWAEVFSFLIILVAVMLTTHLVAKLLRSGVRTVGLGWLDRFAGLLFGLLRGALVVAIGFLVLSLFAPESGWVKHSRLAPLGLAMAREMAAAAPIHMADRIRAGTRLLHLQVQGTQWQ